MNAFRMEPDERRAALVLAGLAAVGLTVLWAPWVGGAHLAFAVFSWFFSAGLALAAWWGNRVAAATAAFLFGIFGPWSFAYIFGIPFLALAVWIGVPMKRATSVSQD